MLDTAWCLIFGSLLLWLSPAVLAGDSPAAFEVHSVAPGIYVHLGAQADANRSNHGDIADIGFIVGDRCVAVIDTGGSPSVGRHLKHAIKAQTDKPVCYVINTHMHPDHVLGNSAFADTRAVFIAHTDLPQALAARAQTYLDRATGELDIDADRSWIVLPDQLVKNKKTLDLGNREIVLKAWPTAHTNNDLTIYDKKTKTLWLSDLLFVNRVPSLDGSLTGWIQALDEIVSRKDVKQAVPGHGQVPDDWRTAVMTERRYLNTIEKGVHDALDHGRTLEYAISHVASDEKPDWLLFDDYNARNVTTAYTELEWQ